MSLQGKVALISGGSKGIGYSIAQKFLQHKIQGLILNDIDVEGGIKAVKQLQDQFFTDNIIFVKGDVSKKIEYEEAFKKGISTFSKIDIVINNAGVVTENDYEKTINVNLLGAMFGTTLGLKYMSQENNHGGGVILNMLSISAVSDLGPAVYTASKAGVLAMTRVLTKQHTVQNTGVRMIALCPGITDTNMLATRDHTNKYQVAQINSLLDTTIIMKPETVANVTLYAIINGEAGSTWVLNNNKLYKAKLPNMMDICELVQENVV